MSYLYGCTQNVTLTYRRVFDCNANWYILWHSIFTLRYVKFLDLHNYGTISMESNFLVHHLIPLIQFSRITQLFLFLYLFFVHSINLMHWLIWQLVFSAGRIQKVFRIASSYWFLINSSHHAVKKKNKLNTTFLLSTALQ